MVGPEYHTFSLNPNNQLQLQGVESQDYLIHGLAINSNSNRFTDMEENQSYNKQVTGAFNNQLFTSYNRGGGIADSDGFANDNIDDRITYNKHGEIDEFINTDGQQQQQVETEGHCRHNATIDFSSANEAPTDAIAKAGPLQPQQNQIILH